MTKEQYEFVNGYRQILDHFHDHQTYVGGADTLFAKYLQPAELGCSACKSACLIERRIELIEYERNMQSL